MGWLAGIVAIFKAIPAIASVINKTIDLIENWNEKKIIAHYQKKMKARSRLLAKLKQARTDEERAQILRDLNTLDSVGDS